MSSRAILSLRYTAANAGAAKAAGGLGRYLQYRDHHLEDGKVKDLDSFVRYAAYRDQASPQGRLFDGQHTVGDQERRELVSYIRQSSHAAAANDRAFYRMVISPEHSNVDLRELTRATMRQLQRVCGTLPPWVGAEHRNTDHPHVHVIMAARRQQEHEDYRTLIINRQRLAHMKEAMSAELDRQQDLRRDKRWERGPDLSNATEQQRLSRDNPEHSLARAAQGREGLATAMTPSSPGPSHGKDLAGLLTGMAHSFADLMKVQAAADQRRLELERQRQREMDQGWGRR